MAAKTKDNIIVRKGNAQKKKGVEKKQPTSYQKQVKKVWANHKEKFPNYQTAQKFVSYSTEKGRNLHRVSVKKISGLISGYKRSSSFEEQKKPLTSYQKQLKKVWNNHKDDLPNYRAAQKFVSYSTGKGRNLQKVSEKKISQLISGFKRTAVYEPPAPKPTKKKAEKKIVRINKLASKLYSENRNWFKKYSDAQRAASDIISGEYGEIEDLSETKFLEASGRWAEDNVDERILHPEPEEEEELEPSSNPPDIPQDILGGNPFYVLDEKMETLKKHISEEVAKGNKELVSIEVSSPLCPSDFMAIDYNYSTAFKDYVDYINGNTQPEGEYDPYWEIIVELQFNTQTGKWYIWIDENLSANGYNSSFQITNNIRPPEPLSEVEKGMGKVEPKISQLPISDKEKRDTISIINSEIDLIKGVQTQLNSEMDSLLSLRRKALETGDKEAADLFLKDIGTIKTQVLEKSRELASLTRKLKQ